jgi:hypothetical protein
MLRMVKVVPFKECRWLRNRAHSTKSSRLMRSGLMGKLLSFQSPCTVSQTSFIGAELLSVAAAAVTSWSKHSAPLVLLAGKRVIHHYE